MDSDMIRLLTAAGEGDSAARNCIVERNIPLVWSVVKRFSERGHDREDLFQIGCIGLIKAADKFDMQFNVEFSTYAVPMIMGEIKRHLRDDGPIKVSRSIKETAQQIYTASSILGKRLNREPTISEIASETGILAEDIAIALEATAAPESIYRAVYDGDRAPLLLIDTIRQEEGAEEIALNRVMLQDLLASYKPRERQVIFLRYFKQKTQTEIAKILGISQVQVSRIEKKALAAAKRRLA